MIILALINELLILTILQKISNPTINFGKHPSGRITKLVSSASVKANAVFGLAYITSAILYTLENEKNMAVSRRPHAAISLDHELNPVACVYRSTITVCER